jgi:deoxyribonuclease V
MKTNPKYLKNFDIDLYQLVWELTAQVPAGRVTTYGAIARALGDIRAARAVGLIEHINPQPIIVPCHRVVYSDGGIGGFSAVEGVPKKIELLAGEGIRVKDGKIVGFKEVLFEDFTHIGSPPLDVLRAEQIELKKELNLKDEVTLQNIKTIAGADVSYTAKDAYGAIVLMDINSLEVLETKTMQKDIRFPYIPTFLSYLELPIILELLNLLSEQPDVLILDGNGVLHPRSMGLATHAGIVLKMPTIGIAKKKLMGENGRTLSNYTNVNEIIEKGSKKIIGYSLKPKTTRKNSVYISPGNNISFKNALGIAQKVCHHRTAEPIRVAHAAALELRKMNS